MQLTALKQRDVFGARHAAIHHDRGARRQTHALGEAVKHGLKCGDILSIAGKYLVADGKAFAPYHKTNDHLLALRSPVAVVPALGFGVGRSQALEIERAQVVEIDARVEMEEVALALNQLSLDGAAMRVECVENAIQRILCQIIEILLENVADRRALDPRRHRMLRCWPDQPVQSHGARELAGSLGKLTRFEDVLQTEALPELVADMDRAGLAMAFGGNQLGINGDVFAAVGLWLLRRVLSRCGALGFGFLEHTIGFGVAPL